MEEELVNPFVIKKLATRVELYPHQMNSELYLNLKRNLKNSLEGKCNKFGFIHQIIKIEDYSENIINPENFSGNAVYNIQYIANICIPLVKTVIVVRLDNYNKKLILGKNGPIDAIIKITDINLDIFTIRPDGSIWISSENRELKIGDYLKVYINGKKFYSGDTLIGVTAKVIDLASEEDVKNYFTSSLRDTKQTIISEQSTQQVEFNEDADYVDEMDSKKNAIEIKTNVSEI